MQLEQLLTGLPAGSFSLHGSAAVPVTGITYDSRRVQPGYVFVPWSDGQVHGDGYRFAPQAAANGAAVIVVTHAALDRVRAMLPARDRPALLAVADARQALGGLAAAFYGYPSRRLRLIGITGTNGKTTTTYLLRHLLQRMGRRVGLIGTVQNIIGQEERAGGLTTPQAPELQSMLAEMVAVGTDYALLEVASHALVQKRVEGCQFDAAVFTNLTQDHLDFHGNMASYRQAKSLLFRQLKDTRGGGYAVVNADDAAGQAMAAASAAPVIWYSLQGTGDLNATDVRPQAAGLAFDLSAGAQAWPVEMPLVGRFNAANALAAASVAWREGMNLPQIAAALAAAPSVPGRFQQIDLGQPYTVIVDYAHTPEGLRAALTAAREFSAGRLLAVFGAGGDRDGSKRPLMGAVAADLADLIVLTSDNPRSEDPQAILAEIAAGVAEQGGGAKLVAKMVDRRQAINTAVDLAQPGDVILIAGKGHETTQIYKDEILYFDDRQEAAAAIKNRLAAQRGV